LLVYFLSAVRRYFGSGTFNNYERHNTQQVSLIDIPFSNLLNRMKSLFGYIYFCITFFSLPSLLFCFISCNPSTSDPSRETKKPKTVGIQSEIKSSMTRISFQDLNKTFSADGKRQVSAIPLLPYPVEHNLTSPND
jgi:hypothetical protein